MRLERSAGLAIALSFLTPSCSDSHGQTYSVTFVCEADLDALRALADSGANCPPGTTCPALPLGSNGCEDLPGLYGHPSTPVKVARPVGCIVGLSYGSPNWGDAQQSCRCDPVPAMAASHWICPL